MRARAFAYDLGALAATTMLCGPVAPAHTQTPGKKSNVIVIFGDDVGWVTSAPTAAARRSVRSYPSS